MCIRDSWNTITTLRPSALLEGVGSGSYMYFVHSYTAIPEPDDTVAITEYGDVLAAAVEHLSLIHIFGAIAVALRRAAAERLHAGAA